MFKQSKHTNQFVSFCCCFFVIIIFSFCLCLMTTWFLMQHNVQANISSSASFSTKKSICEFFGFKRVNFFRQNTFCSWVYPFLPLILTYSSEWIFFSCHFNKNRHMAQVVLSFRKHSYHERQFCSALYAFVNHFKLKPPRKWFSLEISV